MRGVRCRSRRQLALCCELPAAGRCSSPSTSPRSAARRRPRLRSPVLVIAAACPPRAPLVLSPLSSRALLRTLRIALTRSLAWRRRHAVPRRARLLSATPPLALSPSHHQSSFTVHRSRLTIAILGILRSVESFYLWILRSFGPGICNLFSYGGPIGRRPAADLLARAGSGHLPAGSLSAQARATF